MQEFINTQNPQMEEGKRAEAGRNIGLATAVLIALATAIPNIIYPQFINFRLIAINIGLVILSLIGAGLASRGRPSAGSFLIIAAVLMNVIARVFIVKGLAIPIGLLALIIVLVIAMNTLRVNQVGLVIVGSFVVVAISVLVDQYTVNVPYSETLPIVTPITLILSVIYLGILSFEFNKFQLRAKLIIGLILISSVPLMLLGWQSYTQTREVILQQVIADLAETAGQNSASVKEYIDGQLNIMLTEARLADIVEYLETPAFQRPGSQAELHSKEILHTLESKDAVHIRSYAILDRRGRVLLDTEAANIGRDYSSEKFFHTLIETGQPAISDAVFLPSGNIFLIHFAAPVLSKNGEIIGVLLAAYDARILQYIIANNAEAQSTANEYVYMLEKDHFVVLAHSKRPDLVNKSFMEITESEAARLQGELKLPAGALADITAPQPDITESLQNFSIQKIFSAPALEYNGEIVQMAAVQVENTPWIMVAAQPRNTIENLTQGQTRSAVTNILVFIAIIAGLAYAISNLFTRPINQLTAVAERITKGDFTAKSDIKSADEVGLLAATFNTMTSQIQELVSNLESRVASRTAELEKTIQQSEKRAQELQTITDIARIISTEKDLGNLLTLVAKTVSERFGHYHTGIFLLDEARKFAVLRAANSPGGQAMLKRQHKLEVGQVGIVGNVTATGAPRVALDTGADAVYFNNPDLPDTHSEIALPLIARGVIIGALDVQSLKPNAFGERDISILSLLADQIAIAIDNARLIEEANNALAESQAIFREYLAETWQKKGTDTILGYKQTLTGGSVITRAAANGELEKSAAGTLKFPIKVRDQVIGYLNIQPVAENHSWDEEDLSVVESVTERLGLALENARLFEETSSRAARERTVTDITTKIRSTNNPQDMIKIAMEELQRALGVSRVEILPQKNTPPPDR